MVMKFNSLTYQQVEKTVQILDSLTTQLFLELLNINN